MVELGFDNLAPLKLLEKKEGETGGNPSHLVSDYSKYSQNKGDLNPEIVNWSPCLPYCHRRNLTAENKLLFVSIKRG